MSAWPSGITYRPIVAWPGERTDPAKWRRSPFSTGIEKITEELARELKQHGARNAVLQIALRESQFRVDGIPYATAVVEHPGVILSFETRAGALSFPCDTFRTWEDNLLAIVRTVNALRMVDRYGVTKRGEQYDGWRAIEAAPSAAGFANVDEAFAYIAEVGAADTFDDPRRDVAGLLRRAKRYAHPDTGGNRATWDRLALAEEFLKAHGSL